VISQTLPAGMGQCCQFRANPCVQIFVRDVPPKRAVAVQAQHDDLGGEMDRRQWVSLVHPARTFLKIVSLGVLMHLLLPCKSGPAPAPTSTPMLRPRPPRGRRRRRPGSGLRRCLVSSAPSLASIKRFIGGSLVMFFKLRTTFILWSGDIGGGSNVPTAEAKMRTAACRRTCTGQATV